jgi:HlyD family secretion protein
MRRRLVIALPVLILILGAIWWFAFRGPSESAGGTLTLYGNVDIREAQPAFEDTGTVTGMLVNEGARVTKGQLIATIDDRRYAARLAQAEEQAAGSKAALDRMLNGSRPEEIAQAKASMAGLRAVYDNNRTLYGRAAALVPKGAASIELRDNALAQLTASRNAYDAAQQAYILAVKGPRAEDVTAARAAWKAAVAAAALARRDEEDTRLYAPAAGIVEDRILEPGDMATPNTPVYTIALTRPLWVRVYVPETDLGRIASGMTAAITTDSFPGRTYRGWVGYISPTAEFTPKSVETPDLRTRLVYQARIYVCDPRGQLRLGMPATATVDLTRPPTAAPACPGGTSDAPRS